MIALNSGTTKKNTRTDTIETKISMTAIIDLKLS